VTLARADELGFVALGEQRQRARDHGGREQFGDQQRCLAIAKELEGAAKDIPLRRALIERDGAHGRRRVDHRSARAARDRAPR